MPVANDGISDSAGSMHAPSVRFPPAGVPAPCCPGPPVAGPAGDDGREPDANERPASSAATTTTHSAPMPAAVFTPAFPAVAAERPILRN